MAVAAINATVPAPTPPATTDSDAVAGSDTNIADAPAVVPNPRQFKASELPLPSATRSAIEELAHAFKKKGGYDETRKSVWDTFEASVCHHFLTATLLSNSAASNTDSATVNRSTDQKFKRPSSKSPKPKSNETPCNSCRLTAERPSRL